MRQGMRLSASWKASRAAVVSSSSSFLRPSWLSSAISIWPSGTSTSSDGGAAQGMDTALPPRRKRAAPSQSEMRSTRDGKG